MNAADFRPPDDFAGRVAQNGFALAAGALAPQEVARLRAAVAALSIRADVPVHRRRGGRTQAADTSGGYAARGLLALLPELQCVAASPTLRALAETVVGPGARLVRSLLFDKTVEANWAVPWHQDLTLAVRCCDPDTQSRLTSAGWKPWSVKKGVLHVQPPADVLARIVTLRLHLDDCGVDDGALRVLPGSHRYGRLDVAAIAALRDQIPAACCAAEAGDVLVMRPLLLHASSPAAAPAHRRVVHLEWAPPLLGLLPPGLDWHENADTNQQETA